MLHRLQRCGLVPSAVLRGPPDPSVHQIPQSICASILSSAPVTSSPMTVWFSASAWNEIQHSLFIHYLKWGSLIYVNKLYLFLFFDKFLTTMSGLKLLWVENWFGKCLFSMPIMLFWIELNSRCLLTVGSNQKVTFPAQLISKRWFPQIDKWMLILYCVALAWIS